MSKVKLTQKQAVIIESLKKEHLEMLKELYEHPENYDIGKHEPLMDLTAEQYHEALYDGYEIEEEYKVGDWVVNKNGSIGVIERITNALYSGKWWNGSEILGMNTIGPCFERHATTKEMIIAKQRMWWHKHGRGVWNLRENDLLYHDYQITRVKEISNGKYRIPTWDTDVWIRFDEIERLESDFKVICFAEDRKDIKK